LSVSPWAVAAIHRCPDETIILMRPSRPLGSALIAVLVKGGFLHRKADKDIENAVTLNLSLAT
jgi:hypothetical protein